LAAQAADRLVAAMDKTDDFGALHTFRSTWHFLDWAASNGVDLVSPPAKAQR
jgi:hypothetical protein